MLSNSYFLAKLRFDTAENEPAKYLQNFANFATVIPIGVPLTERHGGCRLRGGPVLREGRRGLGGGERVGPSHVLRAKSFILAGRARSNS